MDSVFSAPVRSMPIDRKNSMDGIVRERDQASCFGYNLVYGAGASASLTRHSLLHEAAGRQIHAL